MSDGSSSLLEVRDLHTHFQVGAGLLSGGQTVRAVDGVSFDVRRGEIFGLVGESGSGKTTLGRTILGLVPATSGSVLYKGTELVGRTEKEFRPLRRELSIVFQDPNASLNPAMTVGQGVGHPLRIHGLTSTRAETRSRAAAMLERCGLAPAGRFLDAYPDDLSGGQKQRVVIARALITDPELVVADEPVSALDMSVRAKVLELMMDLKDDLGLTYLYITHDLASGRFVCDRLAILYLGQMVEWGDAHALYDDPQHPYTDSLLGAIPLPDPSRRGRDRMLPHGEIPDALTPPTGCRFHPRCPKAFEPCGWEGVDLVQALEDRWTRVDSDTMESAATCRLPRCRASRCASPVATRRRCVGGWPRPPRPCRPRSPRASRRSSATATTWSSGSCPGSRPHRRRSRGGRSPATSTGSSASRSDPDRHVAGRGSPVGRASHGSHGTTRASAGDEP
jgi:oligopeptide/dipeptide ABC transporter ATP-binding protein